jgi:two-component system LytT family response regulator
VWNALIVDDQALARSNIKLAMAEHPNWYCLATCASAAEARVAMTNSSADLVLLDIRMPRENGLRFAEELSTLPSPPLVVFVTAYDEHALSAFDVFALDYILKPIDDKRFSAMIRRVELVLQQRYHAANVQPISSLPSEYAAAAAGTRPQEVETLTVRSRGAMERIATTEIAWVGSAGNYVELHLQGRVVLHRSSLSTMEARLAPRDFFRVHRTALVRANEIASLKVTGDGTYLATLRSGTSVPVSNRYLARVQRLFS